MKAVDHETPFNRADATRQVRTMTRDELELSIHVVCSAFSETWFPGVHSLNDARALLDVFAQERQRRSVLDAIAQTELPLTRLAATAK
jgi:hypothetical protein